MTEALDQTIETLRQDIARWEQQAAEEARDGTPRTAGLDQMIANARRLIASHEAAARNETQGLT